MEVFRDNFGFKQAILDHVFSKMILSKATEKYAPIYETSLKFFEIFIEAIKNEKLTNELVM